MEIDINKILDNFNKPLRRKIIIIGSVIFILGLVYYLFLMSKDGAKYDNSKQQGIIINQPTGTTNINNK